MIKVLVVDDHALFRQGIINLFERIDDFPVGGEASSGAQAIQVAKRLSPDVIVMDIKMKDIDGITAAKLLRERGVQAAVVLITLHRERHFTERARREANVNGYVLKQDAFEDLVNSVRTVHRGGSYYSPILARELGLIGEDGAWFASNGRRTYGFALIAEAIAARRSRENPILRFDIATIF
ncbi:MAG: response regulator transcription factor [Gammaproteobacteria bacterium]|nr:response regulator transcription factor [Gammaproteobacteria bacterium]